MLNTPLLFLIFNRPDLTEKVFNEIRKARPEKLFVAADGPRNEEEAVLCEQARQVINSVDWDCEVKTLFRQENMGCKRAVSQAIDWFFENVDEGIILEDDCFPTESFFLFCEKMLDTYRHDTRIMHISGENPVGSPAGGASYYFSPVEHCWGWATWKRAWNLFDINMANYQKIRDEDLLSGVLYKPEYLSYWIDKLDRVYDGEIDSWAYIWTYSIMINHGLCINPAYNLIKNIGMGDNATHTGPEAHFHNREIFEIDPDNLTHPQFILPDREVFDKIMRERFEVREKEHVPIYKKLVREVLRPFQRAVRDKK